ncbi:hypothetical protein BVRB_4g096750 [Beta vulgaris subsp. vulgaris]|uniref:Uncharacterized protein n=1 Tax=Beta vulgaris subsp. vulgaris TaxID=3555 RepID=A0A0J8BD46_BETVV|nr:hypothetical protein BVRB_4g096750 [Beta vulgaris subsp. vulgaris]
MQICKPVHYDKACRHIDQTKQHQKIGQNNDKKHHVHFWHEQKNEQPQANKHQPHVVAHPKHGQYEHKNGHNGHVQATNKHRHDAPQAQSHKLPGHNGHGQATNKHRHDAPHARSHKLRQCFGHGDRVASDVDESETIVIERKIEERVVISHVKKCHGHKEGAKYKEGVKHLDRC